MIRGVSNNFQDLFVDGLPHLACVSDNFQRDGIERKQAKKAIDYRNIQINRNSMVRAFTFDIDSQNGVYQWNDNNAPAPNIITANPINGHAHYIYFLESPVSRTLKSKPKPQAFAHAISRGLNARLDGDTAYSGFMTKNPLNDYWDSFTVADKPYQLDELADNVDLLWWNERNEETHSGDLGRHQTLFHSGRLHAYRVTKRFQSNNNLDGFIKYLEHYLSDKNNGFDSPLPEKQVYSLAKSVATWCYKNYVGDGKDRGVMNLAANGHGLTLQDKQVIGAKHTHNVRKQATEQRIKEAVAYLNTSGKKVNVSSVAAFCGLSRPTVTNYKHLLKV